MLCLVSQPNSVVLEIKVDPKAIGQECLEKVCEYLGIGPEADYFGLKRSPCIGASGDIAIDTPIAAQDHHTHTNNQNNSHHHHHHNSDSYSGSWVNLRNPLPPAANHKALRMMLRVKFWVPPHRLLLDSTRRNFYAHARADLVQGRIVVSDWAVVCKLVALIAQAEIGDFDPHMPPTCLYNQCQNIGPQCEKPADYAANIVNCHRELIGMKGSTAEYHLLKEMSNLESFGEELFFCKPSNENTAHALYNHMLYHGGNPMDDNEEREGRLSKDDSMYASQTVGCLTTGSGGHQDEAVGCGCRLGVCVGVGPQGIMVYRPGNGTPDEENQKKSIPYTAIIRAAPVRRVFQLHYLSGEGREARLNVKMANSRLAAALYRAVTEKHAFYCCETVRSDVTKQFIRDLKGTIVSIFNEESTLGKRYVFDIRRTYTEVYDSARRSLFLAASAARSTDQCAGSLTGEFCPPHRRGSQCGTECRESRDRVNHSQMDILACRVCMDQTINTVFMPCKHLLCCSECAARCTRCPLCRGELTELLKIHLPEEYTRRSST